MSKEKWKIWVAGAEGRVEKGVGQVMHTGGVHGRNIRIAMPWLAGERSE